MHRSNRKVLTYIKRHPNCEIVRGSAMYETTIYLCEKKFVQYFEGQNEGGFFEDHIYYHITNSGLDAISNTRWLNAEFLMKQIIIPIVVAFVTSLITALLLPLL